MKNELILLTEYFQNSCAEPDFIQLLEREGLISIEKHNELSYFPSSQLGELELFTRLYYDLSINVEGIDVINNLLLKMQKMERELSVLRRKFDIASEDIFFDEL